MQITFWITLFCQSLPATAYYTYKFGKGFFFCGVVRLCSSSNKRLCAFINLGAIFREKEDAHLAAAAEYAVRWINSRRPQLGQFEIAIRNIAPWDHYGALHESRR